MMPGLTPTSQTDSARMEANIMIRSNAQEIDIESINPVHLLGGFGWSCDRIAEKINYSTETVKSWSSRRRNPSLRAKEAAYEVYKAELQRRGLEP